MELLYIEIKDLIKDDSFCNSSSTWNELCGLIGLTTNKEHQHDKKHIYYWTERITFELLVLNKERITENKLVVNEVRDVFLFNKPFYQDVIKQVGIDENDLDFRIGVCISGIFSNIKNNKQLWYQIKKEHDNYQMHQDLNRNLDNNGIINKKPKL